jgi:hypothetical protein
MTSAQVGANELAGCCNVATGSTIQAMGGAGQDWSFSATSQLQQRKNPYVFRAISYN